MPPSIQRSNAKHYKSDTITEVKEFAGPHLLPARPGWEEIADYALDWAVRHARPEHRDPASRRDERRPHHPHRRADRRSSRSAAGGCSPTRRSTPRASVHASAGARLAQARGPGDRRRRPRADRRGAAQPRPPRRQPRRRRPGAAAVGRRRGDHRRRARGGWAAARAGSRHGQTTRLEAPGRPTIEITATPCRHGPPLSRPIVGDVDRLRAALGGPGARRAVDLGRHRPLRRRPRGRRPARGRHRAAAPRRRAVPGHRAVRYTMTARGRRRAAAASSQPHTAIPIHYEGWKHFRQGREAIEREFAGRRRTSAAASAGCRSARRRRSRVDEGAPRRRVERRAVPVTGPRRDLDAFAITCWDHRVVAEGRAPKPTAGGAQVRRSRTSHVGDAVDVHAGRRAVAGARGRARLRGRALRPRRRHGHSRRRAVRLGGGQQRGRPRLPRAEEPGPSRSRSGARRLPVPLVRDHGCGLARGTAPGWASGSR